jgi:hypothetical protein
VDIAQPDYKSKMQHIGTGKTGRDQSVRLSKLNPDDDLAANSVIEPLKGSELDGLSANVKHNVST